MKVEKKNKIVIVLILLILIAVQLGRIIYVFTFEREGYHPDECSSYSFANSYFDPYIYMDYQDGKANIKNYNEWISSQKIRDFLVVNTDERFSFNSVISNQKNDMSPPLHSLILHMICSFFPEKFSWNYAFSVNIVFFVMTQIVVYLLGVSLTKSKWVGLLACLFYGFTTGALNCFIFLRMYAVQTFLAVLLAYLHSRIYNKQFKKSYIELLLIIGVMIAGGLTHYYFYVFAFLMAVCYCIYLAFKKLWKILLLYASSMMLAVGLSFVIYPSAITNMTSGASKYPYQMPYRWNLEYCLSSFIFEIIGVRVILPDQVTLLLAGIILFVVLLLCAALCFLFRKDFWFYKALQAIKQTSLIVVAFAAKSIKKLQWTIVFMIIVVFATLAIIAKISFVYEANIYVDRYLAFLMPLFCAALTGVCFYVVRYIPVKIKLQHLFLLISVIGILLMNNYWSECNYLFKKQSNGPDIESVVKDANCLIVTNSAGCLNYYIALLKESGYFFAVLGSECMQHSTELAMIDSSRPTYAIIEKSIFPDENGKYSIESAINFEGDIHIGLDYSENQFLAYLADLGWVKDVTYICTENGYTGRVDLYRLN